MGGRLYTFEQDMWLLDNYPLLTPSECTLNFNEKFKETRTEAAIRIRASRLDIATKPPEQMHTPCQLANVIGARPWSVTEMIRNRRIKAIKVRRRFFITESEFNAVCKKYAMKHEWDSVTLKTAANMIGYHGTSTLSKVIKRGYIDYYKCGNYTLVRKSHIQWGIEYMRNTGSLYIPWKKCRQLSELRGEQRYESSHYHRRKNRKPA